MWFSRETSSTTHDSWSGFCFPHKSNKRDSPLTKWCPLSCYYHNQGPPIKSSIGHISEHRMKYFLSCLLLRNHLPILSNSSMETRKILNVFSFSFFICGGPPAPSWIYLECRAGWAKDQVPVGLGAIKKQKNRENCHITPQTENSGASALNCFVHNQKPIFSDQRVTISIFSPVTSKTNTLLLISEWSFRW